MGKTFRGIVDRKAAVSDSPAMAFNRCRQAHAAIRTAGGAEGGRGGLRVVFTPLPLNSTGLCRRGQSLCVGTPIRSYKKFFGEWGCMVIIADVVVESRLPAANEFGKERYRANSVE